uniref:L1 transposable element RRM domain-containing protein n=1 Tax=Equus caballus TaxID=9796 RepID=A0A9L0THB4_HORSE
MKWKKKKKKKKSNVEHQQWPGSSRTICEAEDRTFEMIQSEGKKEKNIQKSERSLHELWDTINRYNLHIIGVPEREEREKGEKNLFKEIIAENFPNLGRDMDVQVQEANRSPPKFNSKQSSPRHILTKLSKIKDKEDFKSSKRKVILHIKGYPHKTIGRLFRRNLADQESGMVYSMCWKKNTANQGYFTSTKLSFRNEGEIKTFPI